MIPVILDYTDELDYTFNPLAVKVDPVLGGSLTKLSVRGNESLMASMRDGFDPDRVTVSASAFLIGTATLTNKTPINAGAVENQYLDTSRTITNEFGLYQGASVTELGDEFTLRFKYVPSYDQAPSTSQYMITLTEAPSSLNGLFALSHQSSGAFYMRVYDATGDLQFFFTTPVHNLNVDQEYEIEVSFSNSGKEILIFIDGVELISHTFTQNFTRALLSQSLLVGTYYSASFTSCGGYFRDIQLITGIEHSSGDDFSAEIPRPLPIYPIGSYSITNNAPALVDGLSDFMEIVNKSATTDVTYILVFKGFKFYHDGNDWTISNGTFAQSNTAQEVSDNIEEEFTVNGGTIAIEVLLTSSDGFTTPYVNEVSYLYSFFGGVGTCVSSIIYGTLLQDDCKPVTEAEITFTTKPYFLNNNLITVNETIGVNPNTGYFEINLPEMTSESSGKVKFVITDEQGKKHTKKNNILVTNAPSSEIQDIII